MTIEAHLVKTFADRIDAAAAKRQAEADEMAQKPADVRGRDLALKRQTARDLRALARDLRSLEKARPEQQGKAL